jgi:hypothetical protein
LLRPRRQRPDVAPVAPHTAQEPGPVQAVDRRAQTARSPRAVDEPEMLDQLPERHARRLDETRGAVPHGALHSGEDQRVRKRLDRLARLPPAPRFVPPAAAGHRLLPSVGPHRGRDLAAIHRTARQSVAHRGPVPRCQAPGRCSAAGATTRTAATIAPLGHRSEPESGRIPGNPRLSPRFQALVPEMERDSRRYRRTRRGRKWPICRHFRRWS